MVAAHPPFGAAIARDGYYKFIGGNRPDMFWKCMSKGKIAGYFSEDFKDLVQNMLAVKNRFNMEQIKAHKWYTNKDLPTED